MKQKLLLFICVLLAGVPAYAQIVGKSPIPEIKISFKRCIVEGDGAYIDVLITNTSAKSCRFAFDYGDNGLSIYDDEGNVYNNAHVSQIADYKVYPTIGDERIVGTTEIPAGISQKVRIVIANRFNEYAAGLQLVSINFSWDAFGTRDYGNYRTGKFELRDLPVIRD